MEKIGVLVKKARDTWKEEGAEVVLAKTKGYLKREQARRKNPELLKLEEAKNSYMDVLFINGCYLPHPSRYRVSHQREQLLAGNMTSAEVFYTDLDLELVSHFRIFIFYRCPYTDTVGEFIKLAKQYHKKVLFDVDDLVIDRKYTDTIPYVQSMAEADKKVYDNGVELMQKTLRLCEGAITTTERLAGELKNYVPEVYINRNVASDRMVQLSEQAVYERDVLPYKEAALITKRAEKEEYKKAYEKHQVRRQGGIRMGYFSGSITHNSDFAMILPVIIKVMQKYENLELHLVGDLDLPEALQPYQARVKTTPFVDWQQLPELIASVDINLVPLEGGIFNEAKSENKWMEAALVKVPTIASKVGAFDFAMRDDVTGYLCSSNQEWEEKLGRLIESEAERKRLSQAAYEYVIEHYTTIETGYRFAKYIRSCMTPNLVFVLPTAQISGGSLVVLKHCTFLMEQGIDVCIFNEGYEKIACVEKDGYQIPVINKNRIRVFGSIDKAVATLYTTVDFLIQYPNIRERLYLVQNYETNFLRAGEFFRFRANQSYNPCVEMKFLTISKWCQNWLKEKYEKEAKYVPNGLDIERFYPVKREFNGKIRILVEGNSDDHYKNVDESFKIIDLLDKEKYEIWFMSYQGKPKPEYRVDKFLHKVPYEEVPDVYRQCHILIKSSILESFSYPPLEMMSTGGFVVVAPNAGNVEYLADGENCLFYEHDDLQTAVHAIEEIVNNADVRERLLKNGIETAKKRNWENIREDIVSLYDER